MNVPLGIGSRSVRLRSGAALADSGCEAAGSGGLGRRVRPLRTHADVEIVGYRSISTSCMRVTCIPMLSCGSARTSTGAGIAYFLKTMLFQLRLKLRRTCLKRHVCMHHACMTAGSIAILRSRRRHASETVERAARDRGPSGRLACRACESGAAPRGSRREPMPSGTFIRSATSRSPW